MLFAVVLGACKEPGSKMNEADFQKFVISILKEDFPKMTFVKGSSSDVIIAEGYEFGLTNLYRAYQEDSADFRTVVSENFRALLNEPKADIAWVDAKDKLRPQFIQNTYLEASPKLIHRSFTKGLLVGYVLDQGNMNRYVIQDDIDRWNVTESEVNSVAIHNLEGITKGIEMKALGEDIIIVSMGDSYDAARLLLPRLRDKIASHIGPMFRVGIPNRDFLIFWSNDLDKEGDAKLRKQIEEDFQTMPYPLTEKVLVFKGKNVEQL